MAWPGNAKREQIPDPDELCVEEQAWIPLLAPGFLSSHSSVLASFYLLLKTAFRSLLFLSRA